MLTLIGTLCDSFIRNTLIYNFYRIPFSTLSRKAKNYLSNLDTEKDKITTAKSNCTSNLNPDFFSGFCYAESCFIVSNYADFYKLKLMENKWHLTTQGLNEIKIIKTGINIGRKQEKIKSQPLNQTRKMGYHTYAFNSCFLNCLSPFKWGSKVKILLKMNNPQVTKTFNSLVGTSEAIRLLSILFFKVKIRGCRVYTTNVKHNTPR